MDTRISLMKRVKAKNGNQVKMFSNMISIYTAAIASSSEGEFENKLKGSQNVVAAGGELENGAKNLQGGASKVAAQFKDGGAFKNGVSQLAEGTHYTFRGFSKAYTT